MRNLSDYINSRELVETTDPDFQRPLYRQEGFDGIVSFGEIDAKLSAFLLDERAKTGLTQSDFATLAGLARVVYSRYELNISRLTVSRMIHLSELLGFLPMQMIHAAAPHLYGKDPQEADDRVELFRQNPVHSRPVRIYNFGKILSCAKAFACTGYVNCSNIF